MRILLLLGVVTWHVTSSNAVSVASTNSSFLSRADAFSRKFCQIIPGDTFGNFVCSPLSVFLVLAMAAFGARGETERQLRTALALSSDDDVNMAEIKHFLMVNIPDHELHVVSKILFAQGLQLKGSFLNMTKNVFGAEAVAVDLTDVAKANKILDVCSEDDITDDTKDISTSVYFNNDTKLVLEIYDSFEKSWAFEFDPHLTTPREFYVNGTTKKNVATMYRRGYYHIGKLAKLSATYIAIPYKKYNMYMWIFLPDEINGIDELMKNLHGIELNQIFGEPNSEVDLFLPKFKAEINVLLREPLEKLGVTDIFTDEANFTGIIDAPSIMVDHMAMKILMKVDERGTKISTIETLGAAPCSVSNESAVVFSVDRPFISNMATDEGLVLYSVIINEPKF